MAYIETLNGLDLSTGAFVTPEMFGAVGDGVADDTAAIQAAIDTGCSVVFSNDYLCGTVTIANKSGVTYRAVSGTLTSTGDGTQFDCSGTLEGLTFGGFVADGTAVTDGAFLFGESGTVFENILVENCQISGYTVGVSYNANNAGSIKNVGVRNCSFSNIRGTGEGYGYGVHFASQTAEHVGGFVDGCYFDDCQRHAVYIARGCGYSVSNCTFKNHKATTYTGGLSACLNIARSWDVTVIGNIFINNYDSCIRIGSEITSVDPSRPLSEYKGNKIIIADNILYENNTYAIVCGWTDADDGLVGSVKIIGNYCDGALYIGCAEEVYADGNTFIGHSAPSQKEAVAIINARGSNPYSSSITLTKNVLNTSTATRCIRIAASAKDDRIRIYENMNKSAYALISAASVPTNISTIDEADGLTGATYVPIKINGA